MTTNDPTTDTLPAGTRPTGTRPTGTPPADPPTCAPLPDAPPLRAPLADEALEAERQRCTHAVLRWAVDGLGALRALRDANARADGGDQTGFLGAMAVVWLEWWLEALWSTVELDNEQRALQRAVNEELRCMQRERDLIEELEAAVEHRETMMERFSAALARYRAALGLEDGAAEAAP